MNKNIVITGSGGILGSSIIDKMIENGEYTIFAVTSQVEKLSKKYKQSKQVKVFSSIADIPEKTINLAIHCAFPRANKGSELVTAFEYTESVMKKLALKNTKYFINISSQSVYAQMGDEIQNETSAVEPSNLYGMTKYAIEEFVRVTAELVDMNYVNIRLGSLASPTFDQRMINRFYKMIRNGEAITIDAGSPKVSYLHLEDAADGLLLLVEKIGKGSSVKKVYNLANNDWLSIKDLVFKCQEQANKIGLSPTAVIQTEKESKYNNVVNSDLFYEDMNWIPQYKMSDLIKNIFNQKYRRMNK